MTNLMSLATMFIVHHPYILLIVIVVAASIVQAHRCVDVAGYAEGCGARDEDPPSQDDVGC